MENTLAKTKFFHSTIDYPSEELTFPEIGTRTSRRLPAS
jgi:hypothetical protein